MMSKMEGTSIMIDRKGSWREGKIEGEGL